MATQGRDVTLNASVGDGPKTEVSGNKLSVGDQSASSTLTPNIEVGKVEVKKRQPYQSTNFFERCTHNSKVLFCICDHGSDPDLFKKACTTASCSQIIFYLIFPMLVSDSRNLGRMMQN